VVAFLKEMSKNTTDFQLIPESQATGMSQLFYVDLNKNNNM
jgi:hypothetical protein